ncbi:hypothetical protein ES703_91794 [subsurface metagenome]
MFTGILIAVAYLWLIVLSCQLYYIHKKLDSGI